ncbi:hypothetical protein BDQ17DRAFT_693036 [Cyathus striatus]|nr:hypothetical protein BDQ17DRAFT_693036 [Cyathus striatus]
MTSLPDDVLLAILSHLPPRDLSFVRQASKHFRRLSYERAVWAPLYRNSRLFLPPGPLLTHSAADLEHLVLRATKLDRNWNSSSPSPRAQRLIRAVKLPYHAIFLHNHYLILGGTSSFNVYDIEHSTHSPSLVAHLSDSSSTFSSYHHLPDASHSLGDYFLLAAYRKSKSLPQAAVVVWKVMPRSPHPPLLIAQAPLSPSLTSPYIKTAYDCLLIDSPAGNPSSALNTPTNLLHIPTNRLYTIPPSSHTVCRFATLSI